MGLKEKIQIADAYLNNIVFKWHLKGGRELPAQSSASREFHRAVPVKLKVSSLVKASQTSEAWDPPEVPPSKDLGDWGESNLSIA